jgi:CBS domain-containing protein
MEVRVKTIQQLLEAKGHEVCAVSPETSVYDALALMADKEIGALMVCRDGRPVGLVSERDYARKVILVGRASKDTPVGDIMTTRVVCTNPQRTVEECMALMTEKRVRHLPVIEQKKLTGIVSIGDLVKAIIHEQQFIIEQLEHYIAS